MTQKKSQKDRFKILACIDGTDESYDSLRYAGRIGSGVDADIDLLYVRVQDKGLSTGGLQLSVAHENLAEWGIELPGTKILKKGRNILLDMGIMSEEWEEEDYVKKSRGNRLENFIIEYHSDKNQVIRLILEDASSVLNGIIEQAEEGQYNLVIIPYGHEDSESGPSHIDPETSKNAAMELHGTVILSRELEEGHGHLLCVTGDESCIKAALWDAEIAKRCNCPVYLVNVAEDESKIEESKQITEKVKKEIEAQGGVVAGTYNPLGNVIEQVIEIGKDHSLISVTPTDGNRLEKFFTYHYSNDIIDKAKNSVMLLRPHYHDEEEVEDELASADKV